MDKVLVVAAVVASIGAGVTMPIMNIIFGRSKAPLHAQHLKLEVRPDGGLFHRLLQLRYGNDYGDVQS